MFAKIIKEYRISNGLSYREMSRLVGCSDVGLRNYETGKRSPTIKLADKILKALGASLTIGKTED